MKNVIVFPLMLLGAVLLINNPAVASPTLCEANGHYYEIISGYISWNDAKTAAENMTWNGYQGHLVTLTSAEEEIGCYQPLGISMVISWVAMTLTPKGPGFG